MANNFIVMGQPARIHYFMVIHAAFFFFQYIEIQFRFQLLISAMNLKRTHYPKFGFIKKQFATGPASLHGYCQCPDGACMVVWSKVYCSGNTKVLVI